MPTKSKLGISLLTLELRKVISGLTKLKTDNLLVSRWLCFKTIKKLYEQLLSSIKNMSALATLMYLFQTWKNEREKSRWYCEHLRFKIRKNRWEMGYGYGTWCDISCKEFLLSKQLTFYERKRLLKRKKRVTTGRGWKDKGLVWFGQGFNRSLALHYFGVVLGRHREHYSHSWIDNYINICSTF